MQALQVFAGERARARLLDGALSPADVRVIPAAAGGPKGLALNPLDRFIFGHWLAGSAHTVHLLGASIGAWRMACACMSDPDAALAELAEDYITRRYEHAPGKAPKPVHVSEAFASMLGRRVGASPGDVLGHLRYRLHVFTSRGRHLLAREGRLRTPLGYVGAFFANAASRRGLGLWLERVVFSDPRDPLPFELADFRTRRADLNAGNLGRSILASCSIPFWFDAVHDVPGAPEGAYWDGGIIDYHLHLNYAAMDDGLVLYPHFQPQVVPGWLDKPWRRRHRATPALANVVVLSPDPAWVARLPGGSLPDRNDFKRYGDDAEGRMKAWRVALAESRRLADDFAEWVGGGRSLEVRPLV